MYLPFFPTMPGPWDDGAHKGAYPSRFNLAAPFKALDMMMLTGGSNYPQQQAAYGADMQDGHPWPVSYMLTADYGPRAHGPEAMAAVAMARSALSELAMLAQGFAPTSVPMPAEPAYPYSIERVPEPNPYGIKDMPARPGIPVPVAVSMASHDLQQLPVVQGAMDPAWDQMAAVAAAADASIPTQPFAPGHMQYPWWIR